LYTNADHAVRVLHFNFHPSSRCFGSLRSGLIQGRDVFRNETVMTHRLHSEQFCDLFCDDGHDNLDAFDGFCEELYWWESIWVSHITPIIAQEVQLWQFGVW
jgi:hypothetical protein